MGLIAKVLVVLLAADAGTLDGGVAFEPVVLDVARADLWLHTLDGGSSDVPLRVFGGTYMDDPTTSWVSENKAGWRAEAQTEPDIDKGTLTLVGGVMFVIGLVTAGGLICGTGHCK